MKPIRIELPTEFAVGTANAYLFVDPEPVLVDTGVKSDASRAALERGLAQHGLAVSDLSRVVITHAHVDHFGQAAEIVSRSQARVWVVDIGYHWLVDFPAMWHKRLDYYRQDFLPLTGLSADQVEPILDAMAGVVHTCDQVPASHVETFPRDGRLPMGGLPWEVVYTPGHASMQTCFYQRDTGQLLSADMLLSRTPAPIVERPARLADGRQPALPRFLESLALVERLRVDRVYPGHGGPFGDHRVLIARQRARIHTRKQLCFDLIAEGHDTIAALVGRMYAHIPLQFRFTGLWMLVGYLDLLKLEGCIVESEINGIWHYACKP